MQTRAKCVMTLPSVVWRPEGIFAHAAPLDCGIGGDFAVIDAGCVPTIPDPNTFAKVSQSKWEPYRDANWWCIYYFLPRGVWVLLTP